MIFYRSSFKAKSPVQKSPSSTWTETEPQTYKTKYLLRKKASLSFMQCSSISTCVTINNVKAASPWRYPRLRNT